MDFGKTDIDYNQLILEIAESWYNSLSDDRKIKLHSLYELCKQANKALNVWINAQKITVDMDPDEKAVMLDLRTKTKSDILHPFIDEAEQLHQPIVMCGREIEILEMMVGMPFVIYSCTGHKIITDEIMPKSDYYKDGCQCGYVCYCEKQYFCTNRGFVGFNYCCNNELIIDCEKHYEIISMKDKIIYMYQIYIGENGSMYNDLMKELPKIKEDRDSVALECIRLSQEYLFELNLNKMPKERHDELIKVYDYFKRLSHSYNEIKNANNTNDTDDLNNDVFLPFIDEYYAMNIELSPKEVKIFDIILREEKYPFWNAEYGFSKNFISNSNLVSH